MYYVKKKGKSMAGEMSYRLLFDNAIDSMFLLKNDIFVDCNPKTLEIFQCTREQIVKQPPYRFSPPTQPDGSDSRKKALERFLPHLPALRSFLNGSIVVTTEHSLMRRLA
jgi:PAS domain-containing protein